MTAAPFKNIEVLVVDDEKPIREILHNQLTVMGYGVTVAESAEMAVKKTAERNYNILVSDIKLGKMDGLELGQNLRKTDPCLAIVFVTGRPNSKGLASAQDIGAIQYIPKPISPVELSENIAIAARWNVAQLINRAAEKYFSLRGNQMIDLENKFQRTKAEVKNIILAKNDVALLTEIAYSRKPQSASLFAMLDKTLAAYLRVK